MVFSSTVFLFLFLPIVLIVYYNPWFKSRRVRNAILLLASLGFYAWGEPVFVFLMIVSIAITWAIGLKISNNLIGDGVVRELPIESSRSKVDDGNTSDNNGDSGKSIQRSRARLYLSIGIIFHVGLLFVFKYLSFISSQVLLMVGKSEGAIDIALPIGISFFTFQLMSYLFDIYYGKAEAQKNPFYVGLYISLFPQLIAGPIVRYGQIASEITDRCESYSDVVIGMKRFIYGLAKKVLIANYVAQVADNVFDYLGDDKSVAMAWLGAICYTLQIYFDFSGYSDMAIGLGRMFGFHFSENFNYPYISRSVTEFWKRWHISLSSWFRDYVYIPLGGNRHGRAIQIRNLFIVWLLTGIWHGANWTFLLWGMIYFVVLLVEKLIDAPRSCGGVRLYLNGCILY